MCGVLYTYSILSMYYVMYMESGVIVYWVYMKSRVLYSYTEHAHAWSHAGVWVLYSSTITYSHAVIAIVYYILHIIILKCNAYLLPAGSHLDFIHRVFLIIWTHFGQSVQSLLHFQELETEEEGNCIYHYKDGGLKADIL